MKDSNRPRLPPELERGFEPAWIAAEAEARNAYAILVPQTEAQAHSITPIADSPHVLVVSGTATAAKALSCVGIGHQHLPSTGLSIEQVNQYIATTLIADKTLSHSDRVLIANYTGNNTLPTHLVDCSVADLSVLPPSDSSRVGWNGIEPQTALSVLSLALEMGSDRSGKVGGTMFLLGDNQELADYCEPFLFEPFHAYPRSQRSILDPQLRSTVIKFARLDGAFIISGSGVLEQLVRKVNPPVVSPMVDRGLGSRHATACSITLIEGTIAITVSESAGNVSIFANGALTHHFTPRGTS